MSEHPLDKPIWSALGAHQAHFRLGDALARRFPADVSPFIAARDDTPEAAAAMAALIAAGEEVSLLERAPPEPPPGIVARQRAVVQMTAARLLGPGASIDMVALGDPDAAEMLALATLTRPGPFRARTHTMGRFLGVREQGRLIAMAGERLHPAGFHEVSGVCTHPDYRGRGLGGALLRAVGERMLAEGDALFLHAYADNHVAVAMYERLGFTVRAPIVHAVWRRAA